MGNCAAPAGGKGKKNSTTSVLVPSAGGGGSGIFKADASNAGSVRRTIGPSVTEQRENAVRELASTPVSPVVAPLVKGGMLSGKSTSGSGMLDNRERSDSYVRAMLQKTEAKSMQDFDQLLNALKNHPWFSSHTASQIEDVARFMKLVELRGTVYEKGDVKPDASFYIVKSGELIESSDDEALSTTRLKEWSSFGESALRFKGPRGETVKVEGEKAEVYIINASAYQDIILKEQIAADRGYFGFLRSVKLLQQLTDEQIQVLSKALIKKTYKPGEKIIVQGSPGTEFFILKSGKVRADQHIMKGDRDEVVQVNTFGAGDYFGEGAMLQDEPRSADCVAEGKEDVVTLVLRKTDFIDLLGQLGNIVEANFIARVLKAVTVLEGLTDAELQELASNVNIQRFPAGDIVFRQGEEGDRLYVIKEGTVVFNRKKEGSMVAAAPGSPGSRSSADPMDFAGAASPNNSLIPGGAEDAEIGRLFTGQVFGEGALLTNAPRRATAKAVTDLTLLSLERSVFERLFGSSLRELLDRDFAKRRDLDEKNSKELMEFRDLAFIDLLGVGTYGQVMLVSHKVTGQTYALKCMSKQRVREMDQREHVENERKILSMIHHPFVVNLVQTFVSKDHVFALMEAVLGGELFAYLRTVGRLRPKDARFYMSQIVLAFEYLHSLNVVYRDLKPENLLIMQNGFIKMADFGLAKIVPSGESTYTLCGTPAYAAPEVYNMKGHGKPVDWWGLGVLCHELISGATPFDGDAAGIFDAMQRYSRAYPNIRLPRRLDGSVAGDLVLKLLHPNPMKRLGGGASVMSSSNQPLTGARAVKAHAFFDDLSWNDIIRMQCEPPYKPQVDGGYDTRNFYEPSIANNDSLVDLKNIDPLSIVAGQPWQL